MGATSRTQIPQEVNNFYDRSLLERVIPRFLYQKFAQIRDIPAGSGSNIIKFRRYGNLSAATTALSEGITPAGSQLSVTDITAQTAQYGDFVLITDVVDYESPDKTLTETAQILGDQAGDTLDQLTRDVLAAGTAVYYGGVAVARTGVGASDLITLTLVQKAVRSLKNNNARKITSMIAPNSNIATVPLNDCFVGIVHPNVGYTLKNLTGWIPVEKYPAQRMVMDGEIGALDEVRFIESTNGKIFTAGGSGGIDVYATLILAANAYGVSRISGQTMQNIVKPLGSGGSADPLNQRQTSGWKSTFVAKILNNNFIVRLETAVAA